MSWTPLFTELVDSSVWRLPSPTRLAWITILAKKHYRTHKIRTNPSLLAEWARITPEEAATALTTFLSPDPSSLNPAEEGRRIKEVGPNEYLVINGKVYADRMRSEVDREQARLRMEALRASRATKQASPSVVVEDQEVEYPVGFPKSEEDAVKACSVHCPEIPAEDLRRFWLESAGRGGRDMFGQPIQSWAKYAKGRFKHPSREAAVKPKDAPPWQQLKAVESLLQDCDKKLKQITVPNHELFPEDYKKACALRTPIVEEKHRLAEQKRELTKLVAANGKKP